MSLQAKAAYAARIVKHRIIYGTDFRRKVFVTSKQLLHFKDFHRRRRVARTSAEQAFFVIPADKGFVVLPPGYLAQAEAIVEVVHALVGKLQPEDDWSSDKHQMRTDLLDVNELTLESPLLKFALDPGVLASISAYLGTIPVLNNVGVWYSRAEPKVFSNSQLYHCDWDDISQIKIFIYASDVDMASGPLALLDAETSEYVRRTLKYTYGSQRYRVSDEEMKALLGEERQYMVVCPAGSIAVADTSRCFHYGSRVLHGGTPRIAAMFQYINTSAIAFNVEGEGRMPFRHLATPHLQQIQRLALGAR